MNGERVEDRFELVECSTDECSVDVDVLEVQSTGGAVGEEAFERAVVGVEADRQADLFG